jgi:hypothetical protein
MSALRPIGPHYGSNQVVTLAAATAQALTIERNDQQVRVWNSGASKLYLRTYENAGTVAVASAVDYPVPPGVISTFTKPLGHDRISLLSASGTTCEVMTGEGW